MGRLSGFKYREVARKLRSFGYSFDRPGPGSHEVWRHNVTGRKVTLPHHPRDMAEGTLRSILREASIDVDDFLKGVKSVFPSGLALPDSLLPTPNSLLRHESQPMHRALLHGGVAEKHGEALARVPSLELVVIIGA